MTTEITEQEQGRTAEPPAGLAGQLVATAQAQGLALTGPGGLLTGLAKRVLETALEVEMAEHVGHDRGGRSTSGNMRNGSSAKTVRTDIGDVRSAVPRDRVGAFIPAVVPEHARRLAGFDEAVLSLYAKGMTTGDIANHLADLAPLLGPLGEPDLRARPGPSDRARHARAVDRPGRPVRRAVHAPAAAYSQPVTDQP